jgi:tRNA-splicing ligase RtcB
MKARELNNLGVPKGALTKEAQTAAAMAAGAGLGKAAIRELTIAAINNPEQHLDHPCFGVFARDYLTAREARARFEQRQEPAPCRIWGTDIEASALEQMNSACRLPVAVRGALMPDAHQGYGLPIGGVLATRGVVIPFAVGMDIACRMKLTVLDLPAQHLSTEKARLSNALERETSFGVGACFKQRKQHAVMDEEWQFSGLTARLKDTAWSQLGTSGSGNHFVEFGELTLEKGDLGLEAGTYLALLSHSGSRGTGGRIAEHYSTLAQDLHPELPKELKALAWLDLDREEGREYWLSMELMGRYSSANHELIHRAIARNLGAEVLLDVENHHNFAWLEDLDGEEVVVHRKGATPAAKDVVGIIPGSMGTSGYVVRGKGVAASLNSASHGAGRRMSRKAAHGAFTWKQARDFLAERGVTLISGGLDEAPMAYKDIDEVMAAQADLVDKVARFTPRLVKMCRE